MKTITIKHGEVRKNQPHGMTSRADFTPILFSDGVKDYFICNLVNPVFNGWGILKQNRQEMAERIKQLRKNNFKFLCFYGGYYSDPVIFLNAIKEKGLTIEIHGELFLKCKTFTDFHGNLVERSCAFMYRIYDNELLKDVQKLAKSAKQHYHYKTEVTV